MRDKSNKYNQYNHICIFDECTKTLNNIINTILHPGRMWYNNTITSRLRGIYCKSHESCIIQRITIVGIRDNNCTIIITAALSSDKLRLCAQLLVWRAYNLSTSENHRGLLMVLEFCLPKSFAPPHAGLVRWTFVLVIISLNVQRTNAGAS